MHMISRGLDAAVILSRKDGEGPVDSMPGTWRTGPSPSLRLRMTAAAMLLLVVLPLTAATTVDRIAAVVDRQVITVSEVTQMVTLKFFPRAPGVSEDDYRHAVLENLIAQALRFRDVERFGAEDVPKDSIEVRVQEIVKRFPSPADFESALRKVELSPDEFRALVKRELQVEQYIQERFAPLIFVSNEEIDAYYRGPWSQQRRERSLPIPPLADVREEIRTLLKASRLQEEIDKWTTQLRARANVDIYAWR
jgi:hypothetical protein